MKKINLLIGALLAFGLSSTIAQELTVDALIRPRFEYRSGFQDVAAKDAEPAAFVSQRSSLLLKYTDSKITVFLDFQDVSVWGDRPQLSANDDAINQTGFLVNQAWTEINLGNGFSTKVGRQILSYDNQRILGGLGWAQQQRTHDVVLLKYSKQSFKLDVGFGFNQERDGGNNFDTAFSSRGLGSPLFQYKSIQFLHASGNLAKNFKGSFLFINNSFQNPLIEGNSTVGTSSRQTTGIYGNYNSSNITITGSTYYQSGQFNDNIDISAYQASIFAGYKISSGSLKLIGLGAEILSGNDNGTRALKNGKTEAFFPLFGTNHKFNGFQDFFFVGRHANNVGLIDINAKAILKTGTKSKLIGFVHYFKAAANLPNDGNRYLGTAVDLVFSQGITTYANVKVGYSQSFLASDFANSRAAGGNADDIQNWGWVMLTVKPNLLKWKKGSNNK